MGGEFLDGLDVGYVQRGDDNAPVKRNNRMVVSGVTRGMEDGNFRR